MVKVGLINQYEEHKGRIRFFICNQFIQLSMLFLYNLKIKVLLKRILCDKNKKEKGTNCHCDYSVIRKGRDFVGLGGSENRNL